MDYEKMGICVTILVLVSVIGIAGISSGDFDIDIGTSGISLPQINAGTNTNTDSFYEYCYKFNIDNC